VVDVASGLIGVADVGYRKVSYPEQLWYMAKYAVEQRLEWRKAVRWAKKTHPAWVEIVNRCKVDYVRQVYRNLILKRYRENCNE
jgi:hypothetical protein